MQKRMREYETMRKNQEKFDRLVKSKSSQKRSSSNTSLRQRNKNSVSTTNIFRSTSPSKSFSSILDRNVNITIHNSPNRTLQFDNNQTLNGSQSHLSLIDPSQYT